MSFSQENITELSQITDALGDILIQTGFGSYVDQLSQIRLAAEHDDEETFNHWVVSKELFGGSGALWEIWIEDENKRNEFGRLFCHFIDHLKKMGIKNGRMDQVRRSFERTSQ